jgi:hypothetical protein
VNACDPRCYHHDTGTREGAARKSTRGSADRRQPRQHQAGYSLSGSRSNSNYLTFAAPIAVSAMVRRSASQAWLSKLWGVAGACRPGLLPGHHQMVALIA